MLGPNTTLSLKGLESYKIISLTTTELNWKSLTEGHFGNSQICGN